MLLTCKLTESCFVEIQFFEKLILVCRTKFLLGVGAKSRRLQHSVGCPVPTRIDRLCAILKSYAPDAGGAPFSLARENAAPSSLFLLSIKAGLRAKEFASLTWDIAGSTPSDKDDAHRNESDTKPICEPQLFIQKSDAKDGDKNNAQLIDGRYARRVSQLQGTKIANP